MTTSTRPTAELLLPRDTGLDRGRATTTWTRRFLQSHCRLALVVLALAGLGLWQAERTIIGIPVAADWARHGALVQTVVASGNVETPYRVEIASQITGTVQDVLVNQGQRVFRNQKLVVIEASELKAALVQAQGAVAQAEARMRQLAELTQPSAREQLSQARATLTNARKAFDRIAELAASGYEPRASLDEARRNFDVARALARAAELQVFTNSPGGADYVMAETQLNQARANLNTAISRLSYATVTAPRDGVLISRAVERGTVAQPGKPLFVLAPDGDIQLVLQIDERNLGRLVLGQKAIASADAYPDQRFDLVVSYINPGIDITRASVQVKLTVPDPPSYLWQDMTVSVDIEVARRDDTIVLPLRAVHDAMSNAPWVMAIRDGRAVQQPVRLGLRGNTQVEILAGLATGEKVAPALAGVAAGQRVRAVMP